MIYLSGFYRRDFLQLNINKKISVIGAGISGQGLALLAKNLGYDVFVSEQKNINDETKNLFTQNNINFEEGHSNKVFENVSEILVSAGISPKAEILLKAQELNIKIIGELDFVIPHIKSNKIICVTGSNGKSTVTSLIGHILNKAGLKAGAGGNLGTASAKFTQEKYDAVVLELSSFQLERANNNLRSCVSIITNLAPDHIDWHGSYENYVKAKAKILNLRDKNAFGIIQDRDVKLLNPSGNIITLSWNETPGHKFSGHIYMAEDKAFLILNGEKIKLFDYSDTNLIGSHNFENVAMSLTALNLLGLKNLPESKILLDGFKALPHRCEFAGELNGVIYIDDSKGTNVAASITAMKSINKRKIIILGGQGKGEIYNELAQTVKEECDGAVLIGEEANKIKLALENAGFDKKNIFMAGSSMEEAVNISVRIAKPGMCVLLSPACTSWDMYKSYKIRGEHFCKLVQEKIKN